MLPRIQVAILEDHPVVVDGYLFHLKDQKDIEITGIAGNAHELEAILKENPNLQLLLMDLNVPVSRYNKDERVKITQYIPDLVKEYPNTDVLVISMENHGVLIKALVDAGVSGYILKDDSNSMHHLPAIIRNISNGQTYFPDEVREKIDSISSKQKNFGLTPRQIKILAVCAESPSATNEQIAAILGIAHSTVRNLLSETYLRLKVHSKIAAITQARTLGLIP